MYGQVNESNTQRRKLIIASVIMGLIILVLAIILIGAIINRNKRLAANEAELASVSTPAEGETSDNPDVSRAESAESSDGSNSSESAESANLAPVSNENDGSQSAGSSSENSSNRANGNGSGSLPATGPKEVLSLALLLGSVAAYLSSVAYKKELA